MTFEELDENSMETQVEPESQTTSDGDSVTKIELVNISVRLKQTIWDQALASADDALVLVQWLESKRS